MRMYGHILRFGKFSKFCVLNGHILRNICPYITVGYKFGVPALTRMSENPKSKTKLGFKTKNAMSGTHSDVQENEIQNETRTSSKAVTNLHVFVSFIKRVSFWMSLKCQLSKKVRTPNLYPSDTTLTRLDKM